MSQGPSETDPQLARNGADPPGPAADRSQSSYDRPPGWSAPGAALVASAETDARPSLVELGRVHIVGIAGAGTSGLARLLLARGVSVSGSEARESDTVRALRALGATVHVGHSAEHLDGIDTVVYSTAIPPGHLELRAARARGLPVLRRASALAAALGDRRGIAIAGTHGKTTTTSLLTVAAQACGLDPSFAIGGNLYETGRNAHFGSGEWAVIEADESDGSFLLLEPEIAVVTNVEADHLENHGDLAGVRRAFEQFTHHIVDGGLLVACADDPGSAAIAQYGRERGLRVLTYGERATADVVVSDVVEGPSAVTFGVTGPVERSAVTLGALVGRHMALNGAAALTVAAELSLDLDRVAEVWRNFAGVQRRFELRGTADGVRVYDDYAHHPTEVAASLRAARAASGTGRLIAVFQPGTFSRTQTFAIEFGRALGLADVAVVMDIFPAREEPIPGVTGALIADAVPLAAENVIYEPSWGATAERIVAVARPGDLVMTMGIGDVHLICPDILRLLVSRAAADARS
ncbi:MAG: UDP-N-acetylmuramate--L-alanine ligase [Actinomycetota bacterium]|nr:UDP-N-acetylmuramate--L-alanine ligase [Actinomycetota bacterium]